DLLPDEFQARKSQIKQVFEENAVNLALDFYNEFIYKSTQSGGTTVSVEKFASGAPAAQQDRIEISNATEFANIGYAGYPLSGKYMLTSDIDLTGYSTLGITGKDFTGTFDGNGHTISNYRIDQTPTTTPWTFGMFGYNKGTIKNLVLRNFNYNIHPEDYTEGAKRRMVGIVASSNIGTIENVRVENSTASVRVNTIAKEAYTEIFLGGITGANYGTIQYCNISGINGGKSSLFVFADVEQAQNASSTGVFLGGITGHNTGPNVDGIGNIIDCYSDADIKNDMTIWPSYAQQPRVRNFTGGVVGLNSNNGKITRAFAAGQVDSEIYNRGSKPPQLTDGTGHVTGENSGTLTNVFLTNSQKPGIGSATGVTKVASLKEEAIVNLLKANKWEYSTTYPYPRLPAIATENRGFAVYYKGSIPSYTQGDVLPETLSDHMRVYFGGSKEITNDVDLRYDFSRAGTSQMQLTYKDSGGTTYIGTLSVNVAPISLDKTDYSEAVAAEISAYSMNISQPPGIQPPDIGEQPPTVGEIDFDVKTDGALNGIVLMAKVTDVGVKFDWTPGGAEFGYRIYRSTSEGGESISISDFPIAGSQFVDVNVKTDTQYYYSIRMVTAEASLDRTTYEVVNEVVGAASEILAIKTGNVVTRDAQRQFMLMQIGKDTMQVNENIVEIDPGRGTSPLVRDARTLVPIRAIVETMNGTVGWDDALREISLEAYGHNVWMKLDSETIIVDGDQKEIDVPPTTINERTMVPVRFVAENVGCNIQWIASTQEIIIVFYT
ncbi:MAG: copper amine oxidase N-terminal domain-containing protein, partial [Oscillospiraceae bacterium]|nr:copper amine oxidase N-terminal domain-containing protein [Oscillospiraceae bacterium]